MLLHVPPDRVQVPPGQLPRRLERMGDPTVGAKMAGARRPQRLFQEGKGEVGEHETLGVDKFARVPIDPVNLRGDLPREDGVARHREEPVQARARDRNHAPLPAPTRISAHHAHTSR